MGTFTDESGKFVLRGIENEVMLLIVQMKVIGLTLEDIETETGKVTLVDPIQLEEAGESNEPED